MATSDPPGDRALRSLGRRLSELRIARGYTQEDFAERIERDARYVQQIEGGHQNITVRTAVLLAQKLRVPLSELFAAPSGREAKGLRRVPTRRVRKV